MPRRASRIHPTAVGKSWRLDEMYIRVAPSGSTCAAVDKYGDAVDFLLTAKRGAHSRSVRVPAVLERYRRSRMPVREQKIRAALGARR